MAANDNIFLGSGASLTLVPELDLWIELTSTGSGGKEMTIGNTWLAHYKLVPNMYAGCTLSLYNSSNEKVSEHLIASNTSTTIKLTTVWTHASGHYAIIESYGAPCPGIHSGNGTAASGNIARLNADNFLGLMETATFPQVEQEMKQMNLALGGTRNVTHQYRGIRTASGGSLNFVMHSGAMLYYALGKCTQVICNTTAASHTNVHRTGTANGVYIDAGNVALTGGGSGTAAAVSYTHLTLPTNREV